VKFRFVVEKKIVNNGMDLFILLLAQGPVKGGGIQKLQVKSNN